MTRICVGRSRKIPGPEPYSSEGFTVSVEVETNIVTSEEFRVKASALFEQVKATLEAEVASRKHSAPAGCDASIWGPASNGAEEEAGADNGSRPVTDRQISYMSSLAAKDDIATRDKLERYVRDDLGFGCGLKQLTRTQASSAIDALIARGNGNGGG